MFVALVLALTSAEAHMDVPRGVERECWIKAPAGEARVCDVRGDFDGDGKQDRAILVAEKGERRRKGIAFLFSTGKKLIAGAGEKAGNGGDDFEWMNAWRVVPRAEAKKAWRAPSWLKGDALLVEMAESAGGLLLWRQGRIVWKQASD